jgi:hypothetical protein
MDFDPGIGSFTRDPNQIPDGEQQPCDGEKNA